MMILWFLLIGVIIIVVFTGLQKFSDYSERTMRRIDAEMEDKQRDDAGL